MTSVCHEQIPWITVSKDFIINWNARIQQEIARNFSRNGSYYI